jgi:hypothetical protein
MVDDEYLTNTISFLNMVNMDHYLLKPYQDYNVVQFIYPTYKLHILYF